ncbi:TPA: hypothetical protein ACSP5O_002408 [Aeromonas veronii]
MILNWLKWFFILIFFYVKNKGKPKKALLSFIVHPFLRSSKSHPNEIELFSIVDALTEMGYQVTIVDYRRKKIFGKYDLVIGFGDCYEYALKHNIGDKYILYSTGSPAFIQNENALEAFHRFKKSNSLVLTGPATKYIRITEDVWPRQLVDSDAIITIGNDYIKSLFNRFHANVYCIPSTCFDLGDVAIDEHIEENSFIWFGGKGCIHKGLDLCIDAVIGTNLKLYIAGPLDGEIEIFKDKIDRYPDNIEYLGLMLIESNSFKSLIKKIPFAILPSCSESMATSIVTLSYNFGTIPLVTKECGFDFAPELIEIKSLSLASVNDAITEALKLSPQEILMRRCEIRKLFRKNHTNEVFKSEFMKALGEVLK